MESSRRYMGNGAYIRMDPLWRGNYWTWINRYHGGNENATAHGILQTTTEWWIEIP